MAKDEIKAVEIDTELRQIKSMADGSFNVTFNVPEYCIRHVAVMMEWIHCIVKVVAQLDDSN